MPPSFSVVGQDTKLASIRNDYFSYHILIPCLPPPPLPAQTAALPPGPAGIIRWGVVRARRRGRGQRCA